MAVCSSRSAKRARLYIVRASFVMPRGWLGSFDVCCVFARDAAMRTRAMKRFTGKSGDPNVALKLTGRDRAE